MVTSQLHHPVVAQLLLLLQMQAAELPGSHACSPAELGRWVGMAGGGCRWHHCLLARLARACVCACAPSNQRVAKTTAA